MPKKPDLRKSPEANALRVRNRRINHGGEWGKTGRPQNTPDVLWSKVERRGPDECWPWLGFCNHQGYGRTWINDKGYFAHRVIYALAHGDPIESAALRDTKGRGFVRHTCDNPPCCNPAHLLRGTHQDNMNDKVERGRQKQWGGGIGSPRAKFTADEVFFIRLQKKYGATLNALALLHDCSRSTISSMLYGRSYQDVK